MRFLAPALVFALISLQAPAYAQGLGGLFGGKNDAPKDGPQALSPEDALKQGAGMITYVAVATGIGIDALDQIRQAYPAGKFPAIESLCNRYAEAKSKGQNLDLDSDTQKAFTDIGPEIASLEKDYKGYQKEKATNFTKANLKLMLAGGADAFASTKLPNVLKGLQDGMNDLLKNPFKAAQAGKFKTQITTLTLIGQLIPVQVKCFQGVRQVSKQVAAKEHLKLAPELDPSKIPTTDAELKKMSELDN